MNTRLFAVALLPLLVTLAVGCGNTLPDPIYANQVDEYFPEPTPDVPDAEARRAVRHQAQLCAGRLNGHRSSAEVVSLIQSIISAIGSAAGTVGGIFSAVDLGNPDLRTVMGAVASGGAGIVLVGNLIIGFAANPLEETRLHTQGMRSWELAVELRYADGSTDAIHESLVRCEHDEAPPIRVVGSGVQFSF
jgi:hypothetical protein